MMISPTTDNALMHALGTVGYAFYTYTHYMGKGPTQEVARVYFSTQTDTFLGMQIRCGTANTPYLPSYSL